jgi:hypothetical protein
MRLLALVVVLGLGGSALAAGDRRACGGPSGVMRLDSVSPEGDLILSSGQAARLLDIRLPEEGPDRESALSWLRGHVGQDFTLVAGAPDRWNRLPLRAARRGDPSEDLAGGLVAAGLAAVDAGMAPGLCAVSLLAVEAEARRAGRGLWAGGAMKPLSAAVPGPLLESAGRFVLVEGEIVSVGERSARTYLNFGRRWTDDFTVTMPRSVWRELGERGLGAASLKGRIVRVRGILEAWNGPALTLHSPDMIEILPDPPRSARANR